MRLLLELDWSTSVKNIKIEKHWRILCSALVFSVIGALVWRQYYPHTLWFTKFWAGSVTGATLGAVVGGVWQLRNPEARKTTSGLLLVMTVFGWGLFSAMAVLELLPDMAAQESERTMIRSLDENDILSIEADSPTKGMIRLDSRNRISAFVELTKIAELFYPSHETSAIRLDLRITRRSGISLQYQARVPERHPDDLSIEFHGNWGRYEILIPGGYRLMFATQ